MLSPLQRFSHRKNSIEASLFRQKSRVSLIFSRREAQIPLDSPPDESVTVCAGVSPRGVSPREDRLDADLSRKIATLPELDKPGLLKVWAENFPQRPPPKMRKEIMVPVLAYRIQEREFGGLSHTARKRLKEIAQSLRKEKTPTEIVTPNLVTGTRLIRSWHGQVHEVLSTSHGYEYRGKNYGSLSKIAREITGTQWSGPAFFGTKEKKGS